MSKNIFNDVNPLGPILSNISNQIVSNESILTLLPNNQVLNLPISTFGKSLIDSVSLGDLRSQILENTNEEAIRLTADNLNEINFFTGGTNASNLRMQITDTNTKINNNILVDNIKDEAGNSAIKSTTATNTTFTKALNTFQLDNVSPTGYLSIQHSNSSKSSYIQWYSYNATGPGSYPRNAYMGLSSHAGGGVGDDLKLSLENNVNFHILKDSTSIMLFDNVNNKIVVSNPMDIDNIRDINGNNAITLLPGEVRFKKPVYIDWNSGNGKLLTIQGGLTNNTIYEKSGLNLSYNIGYTPLTEVEAVTTQTLNTSKIVIDNAGIALKVSNAVNTLPIDVLVATTAKTQISSSKVSVKNDNILGGYVDIERTGASSIYSGFINFNNSLGRVMYVGFNIDGVTAGQPIHYLENQCRSFTYKNELNPYIMKIVSHEGTIGSDTDYVQIRNFLKCSTIKSNGTTLDLYADTHSIKNNAGTNKLTITNSTDTTHIQTANTHIQGNIFPSFNGGGNLGVGLNDANTKRYNNLYLYNSLDINGNSGAGDSAVILRDDSIADNTIRDNTYCTNMILGTMDATNTSALGRGFLRLGAGYNNPNIIETYIDLYGKNSTGDFQQIKHRINDDDIFTLTSVNAQFHHNLISRTIYPESDIAYDLGVSGDNEWRNVYTENIYVAGQQHHSDRRIKDNIIDLKEGLSFIKKIRPVQFTYKKSTKKRKHWGFIAQEIREAVGSDQYSIWGEQQNEFKKQHIAPTEFLGPIVKSIQELYGLIQQGTPLNTPSTNKGVQEHKCDNYELITQLNSYELELLDCKSKVKQLDNHIEELCEDKEKLEVNNKMLDLRIIELEKNNLLLNEKINDLVDKKSDLMTEDDEGESMFDIMNKRLIELENRLIKTESKNKKLTSVINKMIKDK